MGVKVEGVRSDERIAVADTTGRNRKLLLGGGAVVVVLVVLIVVLVEALAPTATYGPVGHQFRINFDGAPTQSGAAQLGGFNPTAGVTGQQSWRFGSSSVTETVLIEYFPPNDPFAPTNILSQELPQSHPVTISGLQGFETTAASSSSNSYSTSFPYTDIAVLPQGDTQIVISASGTSQSAVQSFVHSFKTVG